MQEGAELFLSKVILPDGVSDYEVHQHLYCQFDRTERGFLYKRNGRSVVLLSVERPKRPSLELSVDCFMSGIPMPFSSDLIITKTRSAGKGNRGTRYDVRDHYDRREWIRKKLKGIADIPFVRFRDRVITIKGGTKRIVAGCTGTIVIVDRGAFVRVLQEGIGRGRAFGCGLIWIPEVMS